MPTERTTVRRRAQRGCYDREAIDAIATLVVAVPLHEASAKVP